MTFSIKEKSILNCLLIGNRGIYAKNGIKKLSDLIEEGKLKYV